MTIFIKGPGAFAFEAPATYTCGATVSARDSGGMPAMELACQNCGQKAKVQSFLAAAQQACGQCGRLLMGDLERGSRTVRPIEAAEVPTPADSHFRSGGNSSAMWLGIVVGVAAGIVLVAAIGSVGAAISRSQQGAVLGALAGVLLAPVLAISGFISMLVLPISLEGLLGDSLWCRIATAIHHHRLRPLVLPVIIYVVLPMAACAYGGSRMPNPATLTAAAGLGAALLGAILGGLCGSIAGKQKLGRGT